MDSAKLLDEQHRLRRGKRGMPRIERSRSWYGGWLARGTDGYPLPWGDGFEWRTRECARTVCWEDDIFNGPAKRAALKAIANRETE